MKRTASIPVDGTGLVTHRVVLGLLLDEGAVRDVAMGDGIIARSVSLASVESRRRVAAGLGLAFDGPVAERMIAWLDGCGWQVTAHIPDRVAATSLGPQLVVWAVPITPLVTLGLLVGGAPIAAGLTAGVLAGVSAAWCLRVLSRRRRAARLRERELLAFDLAFRKQPVPSLFELPEEPVGCAPRSSQEI